MTALIAHFPAWTRRGYRGTLDETFSGRENGVGFLRFAMAMSVVVSHSGILGFGRTDLLGEQFRNQQALGGLAVAGFFILSGMLITRSARRTGFGRYCWHRVLRIFPGLWVCLVVTAFGVAPLIAYHEWGTLRGFWGPGPDGGPFGYVRNNMWTGVRQSGIHDLLASSTPWGRLTKASAFDGALWSLCYELLCYMVVGALLISGVLRTARRLVPLLAVLLYARILLDFRLTHGWGGGVVATYTRFDTILFGSIDVRWVVYLGFLFLAAASLELYRERIPIHDGLGIAALLICLGTLILGGWFAIGYPVLTYLIVWAACRLPPPAPSALDRAQERLLVRHLHIRPRRPAGTGQLRMEPLGLLALPGPVGRARLDRRLPVLAPGRETLPETQELDAAPPGAPPDHARAGARRAGRARPRTRQRTGSGSGRLRGHAVRIAAVVTAYHPDERLLAVVESVRDACAQTLVVDNTPEGVPSITDGITSDTATVLRPGVNRGLAHALNLGISRLARDTEAVVFLDQDSVLAPDVVPRLAEHLADPGIGIATPAPWDTVHERFYETFSGRHGDVSDRAISITSGMLIRRSLLERVGEFREDFFVDYADLEYSLRVRRTGARIIQDKRLKLPHSIGERRTHTFLGMRVAVTHKAPWRDYWQVRNGLITIREQGRFSPAWAVTAVLYLGRAAVQAVVFEDNRPAHARAVLRGVRDAVTRQHTLRYLPTGAELTPTRRAGKTRRGNR
ncbi:acyltransferase family protein [Catenulispora yoronensis]